MPSAFAKAVMKASKVIDAKHGERLRFVPKGAIDNWGKPCSDADGRETVDCIGGLYEGEGGFGSAAGDKENSDFSAQTVNQAMHVSIERGYFATDNQPRKGDQILALDRGEMSFEVIFVVSDGPSRVALQLVRA